MDSILSREGSVRREDHFASSTKELGIEEFQKSRMAEQHPTQMHRNKPNDGFPFTGLEAIRQQQRHATIQHRQRGMTGRLYFSLGGVREIDSKAKGETVGKKGIIRRRIDTAVEGRQ